MLDTKNDERLAKFKKWYRRIHQAEKAWSRYLDDETAEEMGLKDGDKDLIHARCVFYSLVRIAFPKAEDFILACDEIEKEDGE